ncbi:unnamed protein product [Alopecurus aequalis]
MDAAVGAARWVVGKALAPVIDGLLESWAASAGLGPNIDALKMQLLYAQGMLDNAQGKDIRSAALKELLHKLRELAYGADDVLDELDYFRIQDALEGTYHAVNLEDQGCIGGLVLNARHTAYTIGKHLPCYSFPSVQEDLSMLETSNMAGSGRRFLCGTWPSKTPHRNHATQTQGLKFDRVEISKNMVEIVEQLKPLCAMVTTILSLELLGSSSIPTQNIAMNRSKTTPNILEPELYGRDDLKRNIIDEITHGRYCTSELTVVPLVGPGGIGKTSLTQHIYRELESSFQVSAWICVSLDFNADKLVQEIVKRIPKVDDEKDNDNEELIEQRLKSKRLLLVLDDVWACHEDEWKKLLAPLRYRGGEKGHVVIVTTRIPKVASMVTTTNSSIDVDRLGHKDIMSLFEVCVFGDQQPWKDHPELRDVGSKIVINLKGFPLAAKTVGRLLRNQLTLNQWTRVAESKEWELQTNDNDIMPALKLSYDHLPFHLQQCFSHCGLFPEDYEFSSKELVQFWIGLDILHSQVVIIEDCPELVEFPFSHPTFHKAKQEDNMTRFPKLRDLKIIGCPKLSSLPPIPWTSAPCRANIEGVGCGFEKLSYSRNNKNELSLEIEGDGDVNDMFWNWLDFYNLADLKELCMKRCPSLPLIHLQRLKSLETLNITNMSTVLLFEGESRSTGCPLPVERIVIMQCDANGKELTQLLSHFPKLTFLRLEGCQNITGLGVVGNQTTVAVAMPASPSLSSDNISEHAQVGEDEVASAEQGLLLLPSQLQDLIIWLCNELRLISNPLANDNGRDGLQSLSSLRVLAIMTCPKLLLSYSSSASSRFPFPTSLQYLHLNDTTGMETFDCPSNLVSIHSLYMLNCPDLRGESLWPLFSQGCLTRITMCGNRKFFTGCELYSSSSKLKTLEMGDIIGLFTLPICNLLSPSLTDLTLFMDNTVERFTEAQEEALHLLDSLQKLDFMTCKKLKRIPAGLTKLTNLKILNIRKCPVIQSLPNDGLPSSLEELVIYDCPAIQSLPKNGLPSSLLKLQVYGVSEELKSQCHKLKGTIPIVKDYEAKAL